MVLYSVIGSAKNLLLVKKHFSLYRVLELSCLEVEEVLYALVLVVQRVIPSQVKVNPVRFFTGLDKVLLASRLRASLWFLKALQ